jgi:hypothetical protein
VVLRNERNAAALRCRGHIWALGDMSDRFQQWVVLEVVRSSPGSKTAGKRDDAESLEYVVLH